MTGKSCVGNSEFLQCIEQAVEIIKEGGVVAFPTETYYGLAADPFNDKALGRIFAAKARPQHKPILNLVESRDQIPMLADGVSELLCPLMEKFWPGPLTLVFPARKNISKLLTGGTNTVGVRVSSHQVAQCLVEAMGCPITATSANISGQPAAKTALEVTRQLGGQVDLVIDGGPTPGGQGSTIVGLKGRELHLVREGVIPFKDCLEVFV